MIRSKFAVLFFAASAILVALFPASSWSATEAAGAECNVAEPGVVFVQPSGLKYLKFTPDAQGRLSCSPREKCRKLAKYLDLKPEGIGARQGAQIRQVGGRLKLDLSSLGVADGSFSCVGKSGCPGGDCKPEQCGRRVCCKPRCCEAWLSFSAEDYEALEQLP